jgi:hypothetical protein
VLAEQLFVSSAHGISHDVPQEQVSLHKARSVHRFTELQKAKSPVAN